MLTAIRRPAVSFTALALLLTGCGAVSNQPNAAIIFDDRTVSVDEVQQRLDQALRTEPATQELAKNHKLDLVSRGIVNQLVRHELLAKAAEREGITVAESDVAELVGRAEQADHADHAEPAEDPVQRSVDAAFDRSETARDRLLAQGLGRKYLETLRVTFDGAVLDTADAKDKAIEVAGQVAARPDQALALFERATGDRQRVINAFKLTSVGGYAIAAQNQVLLTPLYGVQPNTVVAFPLSGSEQGASAGWVVALVRNRELNATPNEEDKASVSQVPPQWLELVGRQLTADLIDDLGVRISPRYGLWDDIAVGVAPSEGEKVGLVLRAQGK